MDTPPKISEVPFRAIERPASGLPESTSGAPLPHSLTLSPVRPDAPATPLFDARSRPAGPGDSRPIHALSALILVAVDSLWAIFDWLPPIWIVAIPLCFLAVFIPTFFIQKHLKQDSSVRALTFASVLAVLAAIPTPITGTPIGLGLLAWTGLGGLLDRFRKP